MNIKNITISNDTILDYPIENNVFVSFTSCLVGDPTNIDNLYIRKFNHETILENKILEISKETNSNKKYIPYHSFININLDKTNIIYIPIRFSIFSNVPVNHVYHAIETILQQIPIISNQYNIDTIVIPLDGIENFNATINMDRIIDNIYSAFIHSSK
jgi:hypothetical protein